MGSMWGNGRPFKTQSGIPVRAPHQKVPPSRVLVPSFKSGTLKGTLKSDSQRFQRLFERVLLSFTESLGSLEF